MVKIGQNGGQYMVKNGDVVTCAFEEEGLAFVKQIKLSKDHVILLSSKNYDPIITERKNVSVLHEGLMGKDAMKLSPLTIALGPSRSPYYKHALRLIKEHRSHYLNEHEVHVAEYNLSDPRDCKKVLELGMICAKWQGTQIYIGDIKITFTNLYLIDMCLNKYTGIEDYCWGRLGTTDSDRFFWGCSILQHKPNYTRDNWFYYGHLEDNIFYLHKEDLRGGLYDMALKEGCFICPYFDFNRPLEVIANLPNIINPQEDSQ